MPDTLSSARYARFWWDFADELFGKTVVSISPEINGNARELSDDVIFAVRGIYSSYSSLADAYTSLADIVYSADRDGIFYESYSREWTEIERVEGLVSSSSSTYRTAITEQADATCAAKFPELHQ
jgi:hypothetical protein